jgi:hypothetical protein
MPLCVPHDDRAELSPIPGAKESRVERNRSGQPCDIVAVDGAAVAGQLGQGQVVRVECAESQASKGSGRDLEFFTFNVKQCMLYP